MIDLISEILSVITPYTFIILWGLSLWDYFSHRHHTRRDISLMFASIAITQIVTIFNSTFAIENELPNLIGVFALVTQPYLMIRLVKHFRHVPSPILYGAMIGTTLSWGILLIPDTVRSSLLTFPIIIYFIVVDGYAMLAFTHGAATTSGVVQKRLHLTAIGSGLFALAIFWIGIGLLVPVFSNIIGILTQLSAVGSASYFYLGLASPRWLSRKWQLEELYGFLSDLNNLPPQSNMQVYETLYRATLSVTGSEQAHILFKDENGNGKSYTPASGVQIISNDVSSDLKTHYQDPKSKYMKTDSVSPSIREALQIETRSLIHIVPVAREQTVLALIFVILKNGSLFPDDDLEMLDLFAEQCSILLENIALIQRLNQHSETLTNRVEQRTDEVHQRNKRIELLHNITVAANDASTIKEPLQHAIEMICTTLNYPVGHAFAPKEESLQVLESTTIWYLENPKKYNAFQRATENTTFSSSLGGIEQAMRNNTPVSLINITERTDFVRAIAAKETGLEMGVFIPVLIKDETVAILEFYSEIILQPDKGLLETFAQIGTQLGRVIERKRAHLALEESESRFRLIANAAPIALVISSIADGKILFANEASVAIHGVSLQEFIGKASPNLYAHPEDRNIILDKIADKGYIRGHEVQIKRMNDNTLRWVSVTIQRVIFEGKEALFSTFNDITEIKQVQNALIESEIRFRSTFEQAAVGMAHVSIEGRFTRLNQRFCDIVGYSHDELIELTFQDITYSDDLEVDLENAQRLLNGEIENYSMEKRYIRKDGALVWINLTGSLVRDENKVPSYFIAVIQNITKRKKLEHEFRLLYDELEQRVEQRTAHLYSVNKELEAFSYSVSHDLRAPLRAIDGFSLALLEDYDGKLDEMGQKYLKLIRTESQRMGQLIDDLIDLSRYARTELKLEIINLSDLAREIISELQQQDPNREVQVYIQDDMIACVDKSLIWAVVQNLLNNAWKYSSKTSNAHIEFGCKNLDDKSEFYVRDNGAGFDMTYSKKLFGAFQRLHRMDEFEGTGIGLATAQRIIHRHGGTIRAEGKVGIGATFYFTLGDNECD